MVVEKKELKFAKSILTIKAVVVDEEGNFLLLKRSKKTLNPEKWDLPGGHLEKGETIEEALKREIQEETGLEIEIGAILGISEFSKETKQFKDEKRGLRFLAFAKEKKEIRINRKEHSEFKWMSLEEVKKELSGDDKFENEKQLAILKAQERLDSEKAILGWKRALADLENYRKRTEKEKLEFKKYCVEDFVFEILPVLDNFEFAIKHVPEKETEGNWMVGILHIKKQLEDVLDKNGVTKIKTQKGDDFDEKIHEVIEGKNEKGKVAEVLKSGYKMGEKVMRPATIKVK